MRISDWSSDVCSSDLHRLAAAGIDVGAVGLVEPHRMKDRRMLGAEALDQSGDIGQRRVPAAGADRRSGRHEVALCRDAEESCLTLFGHAVVRHFDPSYACQPTAFPRPMIIV